MKSSFSSRPGMLRAWRIGYVLAVVLTSASSSTAYGQAPSTTSGWVAEKAVGSLRIATYNASLNRKKAGQLNADLQQGDNQARAIATVIRAVRPDIVLINEIDYEPTVDNAALLADKYLADPAPDSAGGGPWPMAHRYSGPVNTGLPSGLDVNQNGRTNDPEDAWGFGQFPGQYGMAVLSRFPIDASSVRTFQKLKWSSMPGALQPRDPKTQIPYYTDKVWAELRLSSKSMWDVPIDTPLGTISLLASHPTPPAFDGPADHNGCRNHDEIRLLSDYISASAGPSGAAGETTKYLVDDQGRLGGLAAGRAFVVAGDLNSDPIDGDSRHAAIINLLASPQISNEIVPKSAGAVDAHQRQGKANLRHMAPPENDTADFSDAMVGNLRVDYVLPSRNLKLIASGVFWPSGSQPSGSQPSVKPDVLKKLLDASDHHLVWIDVQKN